MPKFAYEALDARGKVVQGTLDAENVEAAIESLRTSKYTVTNVKQQQDIGTSITEFSSKFGVQLGKVNPYAIVVFTRQLATIFNSGIPLLKGLESLQDQSMDRRLTNALLEVHQDVKQGMALSRAMGRHPTIFSPVYLAMIRAGETAGALGEILDRLATLAERDFTLRKKVQSAMTYPIFVFFAALIATEIIVTYVFPTFRDLLVGLGGDLPLPTKILIFITNITGSPLFFSASVGGVCGALFLFSKWIQTRTGRRIFDNFLITAPIIGQINKKVCLSRFCRTLGTLLTSGVTMVHSLDIVGRVSGNETMGDIIEEIKAGLKAGMRLSQPLREYSLFPPMLSHMVAVGEETGSLASILEKLAVFYDMEVEHQLSIFASLIEPVMIFFMGGLVGFVVLAVFLPVYSILGKF
ncbi:MAG: type II secretion system F family protein [Candidatus Xenobia bacterium]